MIKFRVLAVACGLALGVAAITIPAVTQTAAAAEAAAAPKLSKQVAKPLKEAQGFIEKKQWDQAYGKLKEADAVSGKTPEEEFVINRLLAYVLNQQKKYSEAVPIIEKLVNTGKLPAEEADAYTKALAGQYFQIKDYAKAEDYTKRWLKSHPGDPDMTQLLGQVQFLQKNFKGAKDTMSGLITQAEKSGQVPKETWLQIKESAIYQLDSSDKEGMTEILKKLVRYYPKQEYWADLMQFASRKDMPDKVKLATYRLMLDLGVLKTKDQYGDMAELALSAGVPAEAQRVVETAYAQKIVPDADKARIDRRLVAAKKSAADDKATLPKQAKDAEAAPTGVGDLGVGQAYLSFGMYDEAIGALQRAIKKGGLKDVDEAQVDLGTALFKKNQRDQAKAAFKAVGKDSKWADLAELWTLRANQA